MDTGCSITECLKKIADNTMLDTYYSDQLLIMFSYACGDDYYRTLETSNGEKYQIGEAYKYRVYYVKGNLVVNKPPSLVGNLSQLESLYAAQIIRHSENLCVDYIPKTGTGCYTIIDSDESSNIKYHSLALGALHTLGFLRESISDKVMQVSGSPLKEVIITGEDSKKIYTKLNSGREVWTSSTWPEKYMTPRNSEIVGEEGRVGFQNICLRVEHNYEETEWKGFIGLKQGLYNGATSDQNIIYLR
jgi:hypothetical protein